MSFVCIQVGARRGYLVPAILAEAGLLEALYTDVCGNTGLGRISHALACTPAVGSSFRRLASRKVPDAVRPRTRTFAGPVIRSELRKLFRSGAGAAFRGHLRFMGELGGAMIKAGFGSATAVYSMLGEGGPYLAQARRRGLRVASEVYIALSADAIVAEEQKRFRQWCPDYVDLARIRSEMRYVDPLLCHTDLFICPSATVARDLHERWSVPEEKAVVVPYGVGPSWFSLMPRPVPGRVLFVGTADLRKGIHYLAMAADQLHARGRKYEFRIAGDVAPAVLDQPVCRHLTFLGRIPRTHMQQEFQSADVFVLPSLAEGSSEATYEALAAAVPVVTTAAAGSVVRHGTDGYIVPERNPGAIADAIERLVEDRASRAAFSLAARERAREHSWERYHDRLLAVLQPFSGAN